MDRLALRDRKAIREVVGCRVRSVLRVRSGLLARPGQPVSAGVLGHAANVELRAKLAWLGRKVNAGSWGRKVNRARLVRSVLLARAGFLARLVPLVLLAPKVRTVPSALAERSGWSVLLARAGQRGRRRAAA